MNPEGEKIMKNIEELKSSLVIIRNIFNIFCFHGFLCFPERFPEIAMKYLIEIYHSHAEHFLTDRVKNAQVWDSIKDVSYLIFQVHKCIVKPF